MSNILGLFEVCKFVALLALPEDQRERAKDFFKGKEIVMQYKVRYGKIVCRFIPDRIENVMIYEPFFDLRKPYLFSQDLIRSLPMFLNYLVEKGDIREFCTYIDVREVCTYLSMEQCLNNLHQRLGQHLRESKKKLVEEFLKRHGRVKELKQELRITRGGPRKRKGFVWTDKEKIAFYQTVASQPKKGNKSYWQYILDELIEQEFNAETIIWLKSHPAFKNIPKRLFEEAVKTWRKYLLHENWKEMKPEEKPRAFEYRQALDWLNYPDKYTFSTLNRYFYAGKKLYEFQK